MLCDNVVAVVFTTKLPKGTAMVTAERILVMSNKDIVVDPLHALEVLSEESLPEKVQEDIKVAQKDFKGQPQEPSDGTISKFGKDSMDELASIIKRDKETSQEFLETVVNKSSQKVQEDAESTDDTKTPKTSPKGAAMTAKDIMDEVQEMIQSGKIDQKRFRELIPEGTFVDFARKLSDETKDSSFYNIAKVLNGIGAL